LLDPFQEAATIVEVVRSTRVNHGWLRTTLRTMNYLMVEGERRGIGI